jgi:hypothetical protein
VTHVSHVDSRSSVNHHWSQLFSGKSLEIPPWILLGSTGIIRRLRNWWVVMQSLSKQLERLLKILLNLELMLKTQGLMMKMTRFCFGQRPRVG